MFPCVFCGEVPDKLPHLCIYEKRQREEEAFLTWAASQEEKDRERDELRRALVRVGMLEQQYADGLRRVGDLATRIEKLNDKR